MTTGTALLDFAKRLDQTAEETEAALKSLRAFVERMTRINKGRALYTRPDHLLAEGALAAAGPGRVPGRPGYRGPAGCR